ncbi:MAG: right-handed parallel beta-helix repeat-containing protein [Prevotella sp.]|nr:right-handed parallel beta-helix repeat-containing protein [Prevotella sp.]
MKKIILTCACLMATVMLSAADNSAYYQNLPIDLVKPQQPTTSATVMNIKEYGAVGDGITDCTRVIQNAIDQLSAKGGGQVLIPAGIWTISPIELKSGIELHLAKNALVIVTPDRTKHFKPGVRKAQPAISANGANNISITGDGIIDGNGEYWRAVKRSKHSDVEWEYYKSLGGITAMKGQEEIWYPYNLKSLPNFAESVSMQESLRTSLVRIKNCDKVLISGVTLRNAPKFHLEIEDCSNVTVDGTDIRCPWNAQNGDGIDLKTSQNVLIANNVIDCGDDGIVLKAATGSKAFDHKAIEDVLITQNVVYHAHGGFVIGSEFSSGVHRVCVIDNIFSSTDTGLRFKSFTGRGGKTSDIYIKGVTMTDIKNEAIIFETDYINEAIHKTEGAVGTEWIPEFKDIHISNVVCNTAKTGIKANGAPGTVHDIYIEDCTLIYTDVNTDIDPDCKLNLKNVTISKFGIPAAK